MIVSAEEAKTTPEARLARLQRRETTRDDLNREFATLTLAAESQSLEAGDRVLCTGFGSGLNTAMLGIV